ncbi:MAG: hypothetical protein RDV41_04590 [Planctomycetota bacterium]|nr:hypothetical protein [Planctomycetota bacterium]
MSSLPDKLRHASLAIVERRPLRLGAQGVIGGAFVDSLARQVSAGIGPVGKCRLIPSPPELEYEYRQGVAAAGLANVEVVGGDILSILENAQARSLDFVFSCWELGQIEPARLIAAAKKTLRPCGAVGVLSIKAESPFIPLSTLVSATREVTGKTVKAQALPFPKSAEELRKLLRKAGFQDVRAWEDFGDVDCPDGPAVYAHLAEVSGGSLLGNVDAETSFRIRELFAQKIEKVCGGKPLWVRHDFIGAVGTAGG